MLNSTRVLLSNSDNKLWKTVYLVGGKYFDYYIPKPIAENSILWMYRPSAGAIVNAAVTLLQQAKH